MEIKYSIDMVRLKIKIDNDSMNHFSKLYLDYDPSVVYYNDFKVNKYRHNWNIEQNPPTFELEGSDSKKIDTYGDGFSYWLGYHQNNEKISEKHYLVIEYNPNKCIVIGLLEKILRQFFDFDDVIVSSLDIAMDFDININNLIVDKYRKKVYKLFDNGGDDKTHYLGQGDGRIKIYNKARESGLDVELTRYELTKKINLKIKDLIKSTYVFDYQVPPLSIVNYDVDIKDSALYTQYWAVINGFPIDRLSRVYKDKIRKILKESSEIKFDNEMVSSTIRQYFQGYRDLIIQ